jgi:large subunit ribosomal protein L6
MSRIGKKAITLPKNVTITFENNKVTIKGKHGTLERHFSDLISITVENEKVILTRKNEEKATRAYHGLMRALIQNMVTGVDEKFSKVLIAEGVGYKFQVDKTNLNVNVGFTHPVQFTIPSDISVKIEGSTKLELTGIDCEKIGFFAAKIRETRPPEPYKGKGILYQGEKIIRKAGKTGK